MRWNPNLTREFHAKCVGLVALLKPQYSGKVVNRTKHLSNVPRQPLLCGVYSAVCTVRCVQCGVYSAVCTLRCVQCCVYSAVCTVQCVQCGVYSAVFTLRCVQCCVYSAVCTVGRVQVSKVGGNITHPFPQISPNLGNIII